jgi:hypothetical protein
MELVEFSKESLFEEIKFLVDDGYNIEYTRGILEIVTSFMKGNDDMSHSDKVISLAKEIGLSDNIINKLY